jgi:putative transposase
MDFFTVDTLLRTRFHVLFIISHETKRIVQYAISESPIKEFVRQQLIELSEKLKESAFVIHDNAFLFKQRFCDYHMTGIAISLASPNMNAIAERFIGSIRREALDHYVILNKYQLKRIVEEYVQYYNSLRPHQGLDQNIPEGYRQQEEGEISKIPILAGLHHFYYRKAA